MSSRKNIIHTAYPLPDVTKRIGLGLAAVALILSPLFLASCGKSEDNATGPTVTAQDLVDQGWDHYRNQQWQDALNSFLGAMDKNGNLADAYNGAGWVEGQLAGKLNSAADRFARCLQKDSSRYDAIGGWAFVEYQRNNLQSAINKADSLLHRRPLWKFLHQQELDYNDVYLMKAKSQFLLGRYADSYQTVVEHLDSEFSADINTSFGRQQLSDEIERLERIYG